MKIRRFGCYEGGNSDGGIYNSGTWRSGLDHQEKRIEFTAWITEMVAGETASLKRAKNWPAEPGFHFAFEGLVNWHRPRREIRIWGVHIRGLRGISFLRTFIRPKIFWEFSEIYFSPYATDCNSCSCWHESFHESHDCLRLTSFCFHGFWRHAWKLEGLGHIILDDRALAEYFIIP